MNKVNIPWMCPHCNHFHIWQWDDENILEGPATMECEHCGAQVSGTFGQCGEFTPNGFGAEPYTITYKVTEVRTYNPEYGDDRMCSCGHTYYRHFDSWDDMHACGCKYCDCYHFEEKTSE